MSKYFFDVLEEVGNQLVPRRQTFDLNPIGGVSYSMEEQDTGLTWVDGKKIYQKTIKLNKPTALGATTTPHGIANLQRIVGWENNFSRKPNANETHFYAFNFTVVGTNAYNSCLFANPTSIVLAIEAAGGQYIVDTYESCYVTLRYTCADR